MTYSKSSSSKYQFSSIVSVSSFKFELRLSKLITNIRKKRGLLIWKILLLLWSLNVSTSFGKQFVTRFYKMAIMVYLWVLLRILLSTVYKLFKFEALLYTCYTYNMYMCRGMLLHQLVVSQHGTDMYYFSDIFVSCCTDVN